MEEKRRIGSRIVIPVRFKFIRLILLLVILSFCVNAYISIRVLREGIVFLKEDIVYLALQFNFAAIVLILAITLTSILHRGFGALSRMENTLDQIIKGDYSLRLHLRKKDILVPLVERLNKILDLLEKNAKK
jgi:HAMP domain-containing protein